MVKYEILVQSLTKMHQTCSSGRYIRQPCKKGVVPQVALFMWR